MLRSSRYLTVLLAAGISCAIAQGLPESNVERLERRLLDYPLAHHYELYKIQSFVGGAEAVRQRWEKKLAGAAEQDKKRWALLLAMNAAPRYRERDLPQARRWLALAGDGYEAHSLRAAVASMEDDPDSVARHLRAAYRTRPTLAVLHQMHTLQERVSGGTFSLQDSMRFWHRAAEDPTTTPEVRLEVLSRLSALKEQAGERKEWIAELEEHFAAAGDQGTGWVEAVELSRVHLKGLSADQAWLWLEKARAAGVPERLYHYEWSTLVRAAVGREPAELNVAGLKRLEIPAESAREMIALFSDPSVAMARDVKEAAAAYVKRNAKVALTEPLAWLSLRLDPQHQLSQALKDAIFAVLRPHVGAHPEDLVARYLLAHLLESSDQFGESAEVIDAFIRDAIPHLNEPVEGPDFTARSDLSSPFALSFPSSDDKELKPKTTTPAGPTMLSLYVTAPSEQRSAYPIAPFLNLETHIQTIGDLVLRGLLILRKTDRNRFGKTFQHWVASVNPSLAVQVQLAVKIDRDNKPRDPDEQGASLADELLKRASARKNLGADEAGFLLREWSFRHIPAKRVKALGEILLAKYPEKALAVKARYLRALLVEKRLAEAQTLLQELRTQAHPENEADANYLQFLANQFAKASGPPAPLRPRPDDQKKKEAEQEATFQRWLNYFRRGNPISGAPESPLPYLGRPSDWPYRLLVDQANLLPGKNLDVMYHWGMYPIDASLSIYDAGFSATNLPGDPKALTREDFRKLAKELGEDHLRLAVVAAYYEGNPTTEEQLAAVEALSEKHPENDQLRAVVAGKALSLGRYKQAYNAASAISTEHGELAWFASALKLICASRVKDNANAIDAARALMPLTFQQKQRAWLAEKLEDLGLPAEAQKMRETPAILKE